MMRMTCATLLALATPLLAAGQGRTLEYDLNSRSSTLGDVRVGPGVTLKVKGLNPVRYKYQPKTDTTVLSEINVTEIFAFFPTSVSSTVVGAGVAPDDPEAAAAEVARLEGAVRTLETAESGLNLTTAKSQEPQPGVQSIGPDREAVPDLKAQAEKLRAQILALKQQLEAAKASLDAARAQLAKAEEINKTFNRIRVAVDPSLRDKVVSFVGLRNGAVQSLKTVEAGLTRLYIVSDALAEADLKNEVADWVRAYDNLPPWPAEGPGALQNEVAAHRGSLAKLKYGDPEAFNLWLAQGDNAKNFVALGKLLDDFSSSLDSSSKTKETYDKAKGALGPEAKRLEALSRGAMTEQTYPIGCGDQANKLDWKLNRQDRLPKASGGSDAVDIPIATFSCNPITSVSTGLLLTGLPERNYAFKPSLQSDGTARNVVAFEEESDFQAQLGLALNFRLRELSPQWGVHWTLGTALNVAGEGVGDVNFITGPSLAFRDFAYFTIGPVLGRTAAPTLGFGLDQPQPEGVSDVPVTKRWTASWGVGLTLKIK